jgi:hypothetical protein
MCPSYIRNNLFTTLLLVLPLTVNAQESRLASLPDKVKINILKRHPTAIDLRAVGNEIHFSHYLLEVAYKVEGNDKVCILTAAFVERKFAQGNTDRQRSMVVESKA